MRKILGISTLLVVVCVLTAFASSSFLSGYNLENLIRRTALFGIISIGVAFVIVTGGIDLSIGSVVCLVGCGVPWLLTTHGWTVPGALAAAAAVSLGIGLFHGLLITRWAPSCRPSARSLPPAAAAAPPSRRWHRRP